MHQQLESLLLPCLLLIILLIMSSYLRISAGVANRLPSRHFTAGLLLSTAQSFAGVFKEQAARLSPVNQLLLLFTTRYLLLFEEGLSVCVCTCVFKKSERERKQECVCMREREGARE